MTTPRDPLVEQLRTALKDVEWGTSISYNEELFDACPQCLNRMSKGHTPQCALSAALSASAPMPAPERVGVEEVMQKISAYCTDLLDAVSDLNMNRQKFRDGYAAIESAVRRLGGGE